jgi:hypothetical protein
MKNAPAKTYPPMMQLFFANGMLMTSRITQNTKHTLPQMKMKWLGSDPNRTALCVIWPSLRTRATRMDV